MLTTKSITGVTLIELLIVIVIMGLLTSIAMPSYFAYIQKSRRIDAKSGLFNIQLQQVKWRANDTDYASTSELDLPLSHYYRYTITAQSAIAFTARAVPQNSQVDDPCGIFQVTLEGPSYVQGVADQSCWDH